MKWIKLGEVLSEKSNKFICKLIQLKIEHQPIQVVTKVRIIFNIKCVTKIDIFG